MIEELSQGHSHDMGLIGSVAINACQQTCQNNATKGNNVIQMNIRIGTIIGLGNILNISHMMISVTNIGIIMIIEL